MTEIETETETEIENGIVSGIVVDTDYTSNSSNSSNIVEAVENTDLNIYSIIIKERQINVMIVSCIDIILCLLNIINGYYYYLIFIPCPVYGYIGSRDLKYNYIKIYTRYLLATIFIRFLLCLNYYYTLEGYNKQDTPQISPPNTYTQQQHLVSNYILINSVYLLVESYIYSYIHKFKTAVIEHRNRALVVGVVSAVNIVDTV
jgi:hypothetical protein